MVLNVKTDTKLNKDQMFPPRRTNQCDSVASTALYINKNLFSRLKLEYFVGFSMFAVELKK